MKTVDPNLGRDRAAFNARVAQTLGPAERMAPAPPGKRSSRFAYFLDEQRFVVVVGPQEKTDTDLALALGLTYAGGRQLVLVLPDGHAFPTLQRAPWFKPEVQPEIWLHDGQSAQRVALVSQSATVEHLTERLKPNQSLEEELWLASTPGHLGSASKTVEDLVEWATKDPGLDSSHRRGERSWQCMGQRVLSLRTASAGLVITAGIHDTVGMGTATTISAGGSLSGRRLEQIKNKVMDGVAARLTSHPYFKADEHWLQAVIRRDPGIVGVEQPALRELPAWRPQNDKGTPPKRWGRGYIDLIGLDGHGDIRIVETKCADNKDDLFVLQGLDYYVWATAYKKVLQQRLGAPKKSGLEIHYVVGESKGKITPSDFAAAQAHGLDDRVRWRFQTVHDWFRGPSDVVRAQSTLLPIGRLPSNQ